MIYENISTKLETTKRRAQFGASRYMK